MIQFALLFGLGFLGALLLVMILAPAVHRRIVVYTENRIKATMPISPAEVRAQRDMARAVYAAENARTKQELTQERDKFIKLQLEHDKLLVEAGELHAVNDDLVAAMDDRGLESAELRSRLRREETLVQQLRHAIQENEAKIIARDDEIEALRKQITRLTADADNLKVDLATRETEIENVKFRLNALREERDTLRTDVKLLTARAKDAENRLTQEEHRVYRLEDKMARELAARADREATIERRDREIERLRDKLKTVTADLKTLRRRPANGKAHDPLPEPEDLETGAVEDHIASTDQTDAEPAPSLLDFADVSDDIRNRATALGAQLVKPKGKTSDEVLRRELAAIAADMVALTALKEGETSPIPAHLKTEETREPGARTSLAQRSRTAIEALEKDRRKRQTSP
ncbi:hypothetical protein [Rhizobium oryzicola]|uniref:Uncharacterized protein n=1 Tax=Rhizobium oryzicola TaxID=1232668 RepID=A0ABT8SUU9_9HYPH|nr:hypothetical protein [Rhizobium oryzicola]MDO1582131.1 hypothetical protein [Rhizobium oryzicola]